MRKLLATLLFVPVMAHAEFWTGNNLYDRLSSSDVLERVQALGYVMGVYDVYVHVTFCPVNQSSITAGQIRDMAAGWLAANASTRHRNAEALLNDMFRQAWPCRNRNNKGSV